MMSRSEKPMVGGDKQSSRSANLAEKLLRGDRKGESPASTAAGSQNSNTHQPFFATSQFYRSSYHDKQSHGYANTNTTTTTTGSSRNTPADNSNNELKFSEVYLSTYMKGNNNLVTALEKRTDTESALMTGERDGARSLQQKESPSAVGRRRPGDDTVDVSPGTSTKESLVDTAQQDEFVAIRQYLEKRKPKFQDFELMATVGTGTFGRVRVVTLSTSSSLSQRPFALKILKKSEIVRLKQVEHVKAEKQILMRISHPFIVNLLYSFQDDKRLFMLMEYINGGELFNYLRRENRLSNDHARFYAAEIVLAYEYLHSLSIIYRDLKPENLLIDATGHVKMTDFGFAKVVEDRTWTLCGTPEYLAPELIQNKGHNKSVDWWALGVLIFEMLSGYPPYYDENPFGIYQKVLAGKVDYPKHLDPRAKDLIKRLLTHDRTKRYGCLKYGAEDVKRHRWFKGLDWSVCLKKNLTPPFIPEVTGPADTSMFDEYPESTEDDAPIIPSNRELFADF